MVLLCCATASKTQEVGVVVEPEILFQSAANGDLAAARREIESGADVNARDNHDFTALMYASEHGHTEIVNLLIGAGADVNAQSDDGHTALLSAMEQGHTETARMLEHAGAK